MDTDVVIAGGGPTGLMLATELRLAGADVIVADRLARRSGESRAGGLHARTMEVLDMRGIADRFLAAGREIPALHFSALPLRFTGAKTRFPYILGLIQSRIEQLLEDYAAEAGVRVRWSSEITGFTSGDEGVEVTLADGERLRAKYLVGCDGGRSTIRKLAGIDFPGTPATTLTMFGDVELTDPPDRNLLQERRDHGDFSILQFEPGWYRVFTTEHDQVPDRDNPVTFERLRAVFVKIAGMDYGMHSPRWVSQFGDAARQATRYRSGRVLLAGDAAHIHAPAGGQGLNTGVQDAFNLGWKLGAVIRGDSPPELLDTYHAERHPVGARVLHNTRAQMALWRPGPQVDAMRDILSGLLEMDNVNAALRDMIAGLDIKYDLGSGHPLLGMRAPDLTLKTADGDVRVAELLRGARPLLLDFGAGVDLHERVDVVSAQCEEVDVRALLIRPDGHIAWTSAEGPAALPSAVATWC